MTPQGVPRLREEEVQPEEAEDRRRPARSTARRAPRRRPPRAGRSRPPTRSTRACSARPTAAVASDERGSRRGAHASGRPRGATSPSSEPRSRASTLGSRYGIFTPWGAAFTRRLRRAHALRVSTALRESTERSIGQRHAATRRAPRPAVGSCRPDGSLAQAHVRSGRPLPTAHLAHERLGKPTALAVFACDNLSSVAYATEEILKVAVPLVGAAAFALLMPITFAILAVLAILLFSYRQTIRAYPSRRRRVHRHEGQLRAPARADRGRRAAHRLRPHGLGLGRRGRRGHHLGRPGLFTYRVRCRSRFIWLIAWGNLRGVQESGTDVRGPDLLLHRDDVRAPRRSACVRRVHRRDCSRCRSRRTSAKTAGAISIFLILHAFASGGAAVTGVEAISNGVPAFKPPEWKNARTTLMWMGSLLGVMFLGLSFLAYRLQVVPDRDQDRHLRGRRGRSSAAAARHRAVPHAAGRDDADPRSWRRTRRSPTSRAWRTSTRGPLHAEAAHEARAPLGVLERHRRARDRLDRLVIVFQADVHKLIPLYAIGVFTSFTLSQAGMARRHVRIKEPGWRRGSRSTVSARSRPRS